MKKIMKLKALENKKIQSVANRYEKDGYTIFFEPQDMPFFLQDVSVDMVALSENDNVLIEVVSQESVGDKDKLESLANLVLGREKWRFEVIVTNPKQEKHKNISSHEVANRINQARQLLLDSQVLAATLIAWSATEPTMRKLAEKDGVKVNSYSPLQLARTLYSLGYIGPYAYEVLIKAAKLRNHIAHGYKEDELEISNHNDLVLELLKTTSLLLERISFDQNKKIQSQLTADDLVAWFYDRYEDPANSVPYDGREGGYQYFIGGPYDPWEVLADEFSWIHEDVIEEAAKQIYPNGYEWVEIDQY